MSLVGEITTKAEDEDACLDEEKGATAKPTDHSELARQGHFEVEAMSIPRNMKKRKRQKCVTWSDAS